jgi:hypothetical protein
LKDKQRGNKGLTLCDPQGFGVGRIKSKKKRKQSRPNLVNILERICPSGQKENLGGVAQLTKASYSFLIWSIPPGAFFLSTKWQALLII